MTLPIEIRDPRLRGGRMAVQSGTTNPVERDKRRAVLVQLLETERGRAIIERLRDRKVKTVTIDAVVDAVRGFDLSAVEPSPDELAAEAPPEPVEVPPIMLGATIDGWLAWMEGAHRSPETIATYRVFARSVEEHFGVSRGPHGEITQDVPVGPITRQQGERWLTGKKPSNGGKSWAPGTQRVAHALVSQIWDRALAEDEERVDRHGCEPSIARNFWRKQGSRKGVRGASVTKTRFEYLQRAEAARVLRRSKGTRYAAWVAIGIYAGLRGGEAANLRRGVDVDLEAGVIRIQPRSGEYKWSPKTSNSVRTIPLHPRLARWIRDHERRGLAGTTYLFRQEGRDQPMRRGAWRIWTKTAFEKAGIRYGREKDALVTHSLRHTFASWLTKLDTHPLKIAKLMGDTVDEVMRTYSHLVAEDLDDAIRRL